MTTVRIMWLAGRRVGLWRAVAAIMLLGAAGRMLGSSVLHVPFTTDLVVIQVALVTPVLPALVAASTIEPQVDPREVLADARGRFLRMFHVAALIGAALLASSVAASQAQHQWPILRNLLLFLGVSLLSARHLMPGVAWLPAVMLATTTFFFGKEYDTGHVRPWALLLMPGGNLAAVIATATLVVAAVAATISTSGPTLPIRHTLETRKLPRQ